MKPTRYAAVLSLSVLAACDGLREALTAHVEVVASAASQELTVQRLSGLIGKSQIPVRREVAQSVVDAWVNYQLLGKTAIEGDSLTDRKLIDEVMWPAYTSTKTQKFRERVAATWIPDTSSLAVRYDGGELLAARHILFQVPAGQAPTGSDSVFQRARAVHGRVTHANFAALARQYGSDGTKDQGGDLGVFPRGMMVPDFEQAIRALKPGEIGPLVRTQFGYHVVRRSTYTEVAEQFKQEWIKRQKTVAESTFITNMEAAAKIELKPTLARTVKAVAADPEAHVNDGAAVATSRLGTFSAGHVARWIRGYPNPEQVRGQIAQAPDSVMGIFIRNLLRNELVLAAADSAGIQVDSTERENFYRSFAAVLANSWAGLRIAPSMVSDSARTRDERARFVPARIDTYVDDLVKGAVQFVEVPPPLAQALRKKYDWRVSSTGLDRAVAAATLIRTREDSLRAAALPKSQVPMPAPDTARP